MVFETPDSKYDSNSTVNFFFRKSNIAAIQIILLLAIVAKQSHIIAIKKSFYVFDITDFKFNPYLSATFTICDTSVHKESQVEKIQYGFYGTIG